MKTEFKFLLKKPFNIIIALVLIFTVSIEAECKKDVTDLDSWYDPNPVSISISYNTHYIEDESCATGVRARVVRAKTPIYRKWTQRLYVYTPTCENENCTRPHVVLEFADFRGNSEEDYIATDTYCVGIA